MENCTKRFSVILDSRGVTSVRRNHQKYKTRMEQPRVNLDRGQYDVTIVKFQSTWSASDFCGKSPFLIISFHKALWTRCSSAITAYVISRNDISPQKPETIILHFHVLSAVSGRNRSIVSVIVNVLIVILNSATLFELIGPLIHPCSWPRLRKLPFGTVNYMIAVQWPTMLLFSKNCVTQ